jgi:hypothetical protein
MSLKYAFIPTLPRLLIFSGFPQFQYQGSPEQRINKLRHDITSLSSQERTQYSMYNRAVAWDLLGEEISFEEVRAARFHHYHSPFYKLVDDEAVEPEASRMMVMDHSSFIR